MGKVGNAMEFHSVIQKPVKKLAEIIGIMFENLQKFEILEGFYLKICLDSQGSYY